ncbi:hypothetical protein [Negadavirga shengliensis]|uniref:Uncharacterized protein n=1 Tax=Negadavirga shengliensis TaxID=1389218 RepID=A0ABV9SXA6_9BACT
MEKPYTPSHQDHMRGMKTVVLTWFFSIGGTSWVSNGPEMVSLVFSIEQNKEIYNQSIYGEPPQLGIWLEEPMSGKVKTVYVTYRTGNGDFEGKSEVPVALPAWIGAYRKETGNNGLPTPGNPLEMSLTGATQKTVHINKEVSVPLGSKWLYYVEVNVAGDYNPAFPAYREDGTPDPDGNGQPSIVYRGEITAEQGVVSHPKLIGRTEQMYLSTAIISDLEGIGNARQLLNRIEVSCISSKQPFN